MNDSVPAGDQRWTRAVIRLTLRRFRERMRGLTLHRAARLDGLIEPVTAGEVVVRPLRRADGDAWVHAMRRNQGRMEGWWDAEADWDKATDGIAFAAHYMRWASANRRGAGIAMAITVHDRLVGELLVWNMVPGGHTAELGLWASPGEMSPRHMAAGLGGVLDQLFERCGIQRIDAPVHAENRDPRRILELGNFQVEGRLKQWRMIRGEAQDMDMFGLTTQRWQSGRRRAYRLQAWEPLLRPLTSVAPPAVSARESF